ncbi:MAG: hypothetical protein AVDCRST_MAG69-2550 [uncultured Solirubrobacteraceae bacterium]|uniref:Uncharacterized protein n=1 Tax=uncultured Solirubrobacteraceae bacterium TaxID=1162706 RepID=A0A6J4T2W3_9ACTN|nr:MAG: hypothetical protein AVDCRST_MAG69-2550 [uncultured Solirubrobacteraceae bacterium]
MRGAAQVDGGVELGAEQQGHVGQPDPHQQDDDRRERPVHERIAREGGHIGEEAPGEEEPERDAGYRARADPLEPARADVGRRVVDDRVDEEGAGQSRRPADEPPDLRGGVAQAEQPEDPGCQVAAQEDEQRGDGHQDQHGQRVGEIAELAADDDASLLHAQDHVERGARRAEGGRRTPDRRGEAERQCADRRPALGHRGLESARDGVDGRFGRADLAHVGGRLVDQPLLPDEAEDRHGEQQGGEQRKQRVVRQRRGVMRHRVLDEAQHGTLEVGPHEERRGSGRAPGGAGGRTGGGDGGPRAPGSGRRSFVCRAGGRPHCRQSYTHCAAQPSAPLGPTHAPSRAPLARRTPTHGHGLD